VSASGGDGARDHTPVEMMIVAAARQLEGQHICFVGIGPPNIACTLAKRTVAPDIELVYEAGVFGAAPQRLPISIGDPTLVTGALAVSNMFELFGYYLQRGLVDVAFLGASQIDRFGNINTSVIGDYAQPKVRLPGSGGACDIAINARKVFVIMPQAPRTFVEEVDFVTSPGHLSGPRPPSWPGTGPEVVVTGLGTYRFDETGEMYLHALHPGVSVDAVRAATSWDIAIADNVGETAPPTPEELHLIRAVLDPEGIYSR
jgi:glutaconate CoA-transferase subunit B